MDIYAVISTLVNVIVGGGWFINFRQKRKLESANAEIARIQAKEEAMEYYLKRIENLEQRLIQAEATVDRLNDTIDNMKKYIKELEEKQCKK